jgi:agmatine deiminase
MTAAFFMPGEWERHRRTWMCWPCRPGLFPDMEAARRAYADVARTIATFEPVMLAAREQDLSSLPSMTDVEIWTVALDDSWARDIGPTFLKDRAGNRQAVQWRFNAWGGKYQPYDQDALFAARLAEKLGMPLRQAPLTCEGGAIHSDGAGTLLTTEQCLLNPNRNPGLSKGEITAILKDMTGAERVIWLGSGFSDLETDGHVDNIACFAAPGRVIVGVPDSKGHPDHVPVREAILRLKREGAEIVELVQPRTVRRDAGGRLLPTSYVNFALANGGLVMPAFDDPHDQKARAILADCFPGRDIRSVPALAIVAGGGGIHCITLQEPA